MVVVDRRFLLFAQAMAIEAGGVHSDRHVLGIGKVLGEDLAQVGVEEVGEELRLDVPLLVIVGDGNLFEAERLEEAAVGIESVRSSR